MSETPNLVVRSAEIARSNQLKLIQDMLESYDRKAKPTWENNRPVNVTFSMDLYQILELVSVDFLYQRSTKKC